MGNEWYITTGYELGWDNGETPVLAFTTGDSDEGIVGGIYPTLEDDKFHVEFDAYVNGNNDYIVAEFRRFPSAQVLMRDPEIGDFFERFYGEYLPEIPSDLKERYIATVEDWKDSKTPGVWESGLAFRLDKDVLDIDEDTKVIQFVQQDSPSEVRLQLQAEQTEDDDIKWSMMFVDGESFDITDETMSELGLESIRTFADDEKEFLETLKLVLPADEAKKAIRDLLIALR